MATLTALRSLPRGLARALPVRLTLLAAAFLAGCAPTTRPVLLEGPPERAEPDRRWEKYGAYYPVDELFVEASYSSGIAHSPVVKFIVNKQIRILTAEGARYGTVQVPHYAPYPGVFKVLHWDSLGRPVKAAIDPIRSEFLKSGKIVVPNVAAGSLISIYAEFNTASPVTTLEHWFSGPIPVAKGRFTFSRLNVYTYDTKAYGPVREGRTDRMQGSEALSYETWQVEDALPRSRVEYQDDIDLTEPRVALVIRRLHGQKVFATWSEVSKSYEDIALRTSFFHSTRKLRKLVDSLSAGKPGEMEKASAAFAWLQGNVSHDAGPIRAIDPDRVIASGKGNLWEMAVVMREMFNHLGLETNVLITRPRSLGGFDPDFVSPAQLGIPLVTARIGKSTLLAYPWARGAALGEYPVDYLGVQALSLDDRTSMPLPDPAGKGSSTRNVFRLPADPEEGAIALDMELGGYIAFSTRNLLVDESRKDIQEAFQKVLTRLGTSNALARCEVKGLDRPGEPVTASLAFSNPDQAVTRKGETQLRLSHLFHVFFATYDTSRTAGFRTHVDFEHVEEVRVPKSPERPLAADIPCKDLSNDLFTQACAVEDTPTGYVFTRKVLVRRGRFTAERMRGLAADIAELNRVKEGALVWRSAGVPVPEAPAAKRRGR